MGATTYRLMSGFAAQMPDDPGMAGLTALPKVVFSSTLEEPLSWADSELVARGRRRGGARDEGPGLAPAEDDRQPQPVPFAPRRRAGRPLPRGRLPGHHRRHGEGPHLRRLPRRRPRPGRQAARSTAGSSCSSTSPPCSTDPPATVRPEGRMTEEILDLGDVRLCVEAFGRARRPDDPADLGSGGVDGRVGPRVVRAAGGRRSPGGALRPPRQRTLHVEPGGPPVVPGQRPEPVTCCASWTPSTSTVRTWSACPWAAGSRRRWPRVTPTGSPRLTLVATSPAGRRQDESPLPATRATCRGDVRQPAARARLDGPGGGRRPPGRELPPVRRLPRLRRTCRTPAGGARRRPDRRHRGGQQEPLAGRGRRRGRRASP